MNITTFIQNDILAPRLRDKQVLVVYDPRQRYRTLCLEMASEQTVVVDASESSIISREHAMETLLRLGRKEIEYLLIYVPAPKPLEDDDKQQDPFALYAACGSVFPDGDGDTYASICLKAKPDYATELRAVFEEDDNPEFAVIDAIGSSWDWPHLRTLLEVESARDILSALLTPNESQHTALKNDDAWTVEARKLLRSAVGLTLKTKGKTWTSISAELWRFLLFSDFVYDLPVPLPSELQNVPHADEPARPLVEDICERLRSDRRFQSIYIQKAEKIEEELRLPEFCGQLDDLGSRDTFAFEERTFLKNAINALMVANTDQARDILSQHAISVWTGKGESQVQWDLLRSALALIESCEDCERMLNDNARTMDNLIDFYITRLREVDQRHREFEQAVSDYAWQDSQGIMVPLENQMRTMYGNLAEKVQRLFTRHLPQCGWPISGRLANVDVFDSLVAPKLEQSGNKVAFIQVDALRYELGVALEKQLAEDARAQITPALAQLPSITSVGMASLLPDAATGLRLAKTESGFTPYIHEHPVGNVAQRMDVFRKRYGNRFQEGRLEEFVRNQYTVEEDIDLLVLRSVEIDSQFENHPDTAPAESVNALKRIRVAIHKLKGFGFHEIVIATDHGFFLNTHAGAGDTCTKLTGNWINVHERSLLGEGSPDNHHYCIPTEKAGIRSEYKNIAGPLSLATYRSDLLYYHGGCSLQECIVPVIELQLVDRTEPKITKEIVHLNYKNGAKRITTRLPVIDIRMGSNMMIQISEKDVEVLLEAYDRKGNVVGVAKTGGVVNPATGSIMLKSRDPIQVTLKMDMNFEGKFTLKALNPTTMMVYDQLKLETDYTV